MQTSIPHVDSKSYKRLSLSLRRASAFCTTAIILCACLCRTGHAYSTIQVSTGAPAGLETAFIAATTNQFLANVVTIPFFANTYQILLYGPNPAYNPPVTNQQLINSIVAISTADFYYGFSDGEDYRNNVNIGYSVNLASLCGSATNFNLIQTTTSTFDKATCEDSLGTLIDQFYMINLSTPITIPPNGQ